MKDGSEQFFMVDAKNADSAKAKVEKVGGVCVYRTLPTKLVQGMWHAQQE